MAFARSILASVSSLRQHADPKWAKSIHAEIAAIVEIGKPRIAKEAWEVIHSRERDLAAGLKGLVLHAVDKQLQIMRALWEHRQNIEASTNNASKLLKDAVLDIERAASGLKDAIIAYNLLGSYALDGALLEMSSLSHFSDPGSPMPQIFGAEGFWDAFQKCIVALEKARQEMLPLPV